MLKPKLLIIGYSSLARRRIIPSLKKHKRFNYCICSKSNKINSKKKIFYNNYEDALKNFTNARFINIDHPNDVSFNTSLCESSLKFVTPDSANLVFESLSTHGKTYLIQIESPNYRRWFGSKKIRSTMNNLVISKRVGVVSLLAKKNKLIISKIENPHPGIQPLAEVEKISFAIQKYLRGQ